MSQIGIGLGDFVYHIHTTEDTCPIGEEPCRFRQTYPQLLEGRGYQVEQVSTIYDPIWAPEGIQVPEL